MRQLFYMAASYSTVETRPSKLGLHAASCLSNSLLGQTPTLWFFPYSISIHMAQLVCRAGSERSEAAEGVGSGEQQAQKDVGRQDAGSRSNDGCAVKKVVTPAAKKPVAQHLIEGFSLSERVACKLAGLSRTALRYQPRTNVDGHKCSKTNRPQRLHFRFML